MRLFRRSKHLTTSAGSVESEIDFSITDVAEFEADVALWRSRLEALDAAPLVDLGSLKYLSPAAIKQMRSEKAKRAKEAKKVAGKVDSQPQKTKKTSTRTQQAKS